MADKVPSLSKPLQIGSLTLKNRVIMASLTRNRGMIPTEDLHVKYYAQRASAGLILTEATFIEPQGSEWPAAPGLWSAKQIAAWKKVTEAVHAKDGAIFAQLWHIGRVAHPLHQAGQPNVGPSAIAAKGGKFRYLTGAPGYVTPEAIATADVPHYIGLYRRAAKHAKEAGFNGVELHGANGYLAAQFMESSSNKRTDNYGGSIENRARFPLAVIDALIEEMGDSKKVGIKISPAGGYNDMGDPLPEAIEFFSYLVDELDKRNIGYIQFNRYTPDFDPEGRGNKMDVVAELLPRVKNAAVFLNGALTGEEAEGLVQSGKIAGAVFGRPFIANPDLPKALQTGATIKHPDYMKLYGTMGEESTWAAGYNDYPPISA
ncbi:hypothetical protein SmJEL517_g02981 [Synchytrium microbalum]|uniref:NADH:flavin oxidoreductase/NADH oxidase N-terminal domain-containing protein n=1 Tax=Synchytrium microbalum TaxID=1806994 RepID=A0A507C4C0_9FUNG|nr:uncharacterized protein SmJEL517_g02981 [Synchytrium microbalum]TPX34321.1 hypothetical protein SmJEL517_g02981 [Synchytrium microbalum]